MLTPVPSTQFNKDFKRIVQSPKFSQSQYLIVTSLLLAGKDLPAKYLNHTLSGDYDNFLECHITNDCLLIYRIIQDELCLVRIGTHSELFKK